MRSVRANSRMRWIFLIMVLMPSIPASRTKRFRRRNRAGRDRSTLESMVWVFIWSALRFGLNSARQTLNWFFSSSEASTTARQMSRMRVSSGIARLPLK